MSIKLTPLEDKIIVKQAEAQTQTASGLYIPDNAKEKPQQGEVLAVGPGRRDDKGERIPMDVKVGDKVLYSKYGGTEVHYEGEDYLIVGARRGFLLLGGKGLPLREGSRKLLPPNAQPCLLCIKVHARNVVEFGVAPHLHWVTDWGPYGRGSVGDLAERLKTFCTRRQ